MSRYHYSCFHIKSLRHKGLIITQVVLSPMHWLWLWIYLIWFRACAARFCCLHPTVAKTGLSIEDRNIVQGRIIKKHCIIQVKNINPWSRSAPWISALPSITVLPQLHVLRSVFSSKREVSEQWPSHMAEVKLQEDTASAVLSLALPAQWALSAPSLWITQKHGEMSLQSNAEKMALRSQVTSLHWGR